MKEISGWIKAWGTVEVDDNATEEEMREALADRLGFVYFTTVYPEDVVLEDDENE